MLNIESVFKIVLVLSGTYLTRLLPLSPVYFSFMLGLVVLMLCKAQDSKKQLIDVLNLYLLVFIIYLIPTQIVEHADLHTFINVLVSYLTFIILTYMGSRMLEYDIQKSALLFVRYSLVLLIIESTWRLTHPQWILESGLVVAEEDVSIYPFKVSSIMFQDSNFVGTYTATMFFFCNYLTGISTRKKRLYKTLFAILSILTLSRAAMLGIVFIAFLRYLSQLYKRNTAIFLFFGIPIVISILGYIVTLVATDDSFMSKFYILEQTADFFIHATIDQQLFGVGFANAKYFLGIGSHNLLVTYLVDSGVIGLLLMLGFPIIYLIKTKGLGWDIILAFFTIGMSLAGHGVPFYYAQLAVVYILSLNIYKSNMYED